MRRLAETIKSGSEFFLGHGADNSTENRKPVGQVLASFAKEIAGKLSNIVIGYFPDQESVKDMDVCSIEAGIHVPENSDYVDDVTDVTAIALGSSAIDSPAFPGALRLASVQCFSVENPNLEKVEKMADVTFKDVQTFIQERNVFPHQLFNEKDLRNDREFATVFQAEKIANDKVVELEKQLKESNETNESIESKAKLAAAKDRFTELMPKDLTKKQKDFILARFKPDKVAELDDKQIGEYIEQERKDFADTAKLFGVTDNSQAGNGDDESKNDDAGDEGDLSPEDAALKLVGVV